MLNEVLNSQLGGSMPGASLRVQTQSTAVEGLGSLAEYERLLEQLQERLTELPAASPELPTPPETSLVESEEGALDKESQISSHSIHYPLITGQADTLMDEVHPDSISRVQAVSLGQSASVPEVFTRGAEPAMLRQREDLPGQMASFVEVARTGASLAPSMSARQVLSSPPDPHWVEERMPSFPTHLEITARGTSRAEWLARSAVMAGGPITDRAETGTLLAPALPTTISPEAAASSGISGSQRSVSSISSGHEWQPLALPEDDSQWGKTLLNTLRDRVSMQLNQNVKQASIRLDPPELGKLELTVRLEGDKLAVQLNASHPVMREALQQHSERLRLSLVTQHGQGVEVNVGQQQQQGSGGGKHPMEESTILAGQRRDHSGSVATSVELERLNMLV